MTKKDKKLHKLSKDKEDAEMVVEENASKRKRKRPSDLDNLVETYELCNKQTVIAEPSPKKTKKNKNKFKSKSDQKEVTLEIVESPPEKKSKRKSAKQSQDVLDTDILKQPKVNLGLDDEVIAETSPKKSKKKKSKGKSEQKEVILETVEPEQSPPQKKRKKDKKKKPAEESLGVVDTHILKQAKVNLGLDIVDDPVSEQKENVEDEQNSKQKKKKKKDKKLQVVSSSEPNEKNRNERALEYLRLWQADKKKWKFNKMMQVQLFHIMYDKSLVTDEDFEALLLYLDGLKGKGRERTMEDAKKIFDKEETEGAADTDKENRARQVFQMLS